MLTGSTVSAGHGQKKSRRKEIAIGCLLAFPTVKAAAKAAGVSEITLHRWLKEPQFATDYRQARERVLETATEQLRSGALQAVEVLRQVATNKKAPAASRVQAARSFLEATGLLKGLAASVTVNNIPQDREGIDEAIRVQLSAMLRTDHQFRDAVKRMLMELEGKNEPTVN